MLQFSLSAHYAVHAVIRIAQADHRSLGDLADDLGVPIGELEGILTLLEEGGLVRLKRGELGCYILAKRLNQISLLEIIEAVEGPLQAESVYSSDDDFDEALREVCHLATEECRRVLAATSVAELVAVRPASG